METTTVNNSNTEESEEYEHEHHQNEQHHQDAYEEEEEDDDEPQQQSWVTKTPPSPSTIVTVKFLVSNNSAGSIIGKSGSTINDLQSKSNCKIQLSQHGRYWPGTMDRVGLIQGTMEDVNKGLALIFNMLWDLELEQRAGRQQDQHHQEQEEEEEESEQSNHDNDMEENRENNTSTPPPTNATTSPPASPPSSSNNNYNNPNIYYSIRILLPNAACGMLIGKAGSNVKSMKELTNVDTVRLSPRQLHNNSNNFVTERVLTISTSANPQSCLDCTSLVLNGIASHPHICQYAHMSTSYSNNHNNNNRYGSQSSSGREYRSSTLSSTTATTASMSSSSLLHTPTKTTSDNTTALQHPTSTTTPSLEENDNLNELQQRIDSTFRVGGTNLLDNNNNNSAVGVGVGVGVVGVGVGVGNTIGAVGQSPDKQSQTSSPTARLSSFYELASVGGQTLASPNLNPSPPTNAHNTTTPQDATTTTTDNDPDTITVKLTIPNIHVGAIMGRKGRTITEIQSKSKTVIRISPRTVAANTPGATTDNTTYNDRFVEISGSNKDDVDYAQLLIRQQVDGSNSSNNGGDN